MQTMLVRYIKIAIYAALLMQLSVFSSAFAQTSYEKMLRAVQEGDFKEVKLLLDRGMDPNTTDPKGHSILMIAARKGEAEIVSLLVSRRANVGQRSPSGDTALLMASLNGDLGIIRRLLEAGGELNPAQGWTPLHYAAFAGKAEAAKLFLERGADKDAIAPNGYTPIMLAARNGHLEAARVILYADPDVNYRTPAGDTALRIARKRDMKELADLLVQAGAVE
jgi:ankyrin repeat protein